jgi:glycosyltransferase involved in cell wall biosynthesis
MFNFEDYSKMISCLLVTSKGRFEFFKKSVDCFFYQTYKNKQLVIVNEGDKEYQEKIKDYVQGKDNVKLILLDGYYSLGSLRNISIALCDGDLFVQWDDDDFNSPERLSIQFNVLLKNNKAKICYFGDQLHYYFDKNMLFWENWDMYCSWGNIQYCLIPGTIMAWKNKFEHRYPSAGSFCKAGEDSELAKKIQDDEIVLLKDFGYTNIYSYHGNNVWDIEHHMNISKKRSMMCDHLLMNKKNICRTLDKVNIADNIKIMGREGLAFIYKKNDKL